MAETVVTALFWTIVVVLAIAAAAGSRMRRYPGTWRHAFDPRYSQDRENLRTARAKLRRAEKTVAAEHDRARSAVDSAAQQHRARVKEAEQHLAGLRDPGRGALLSSLGDQLDLYEHALRVTTGSLANTHSLLGLALDDQYSRKEAFIYLTAGTRKDLLTLSLEETPEAEVRAFVVQVHNSIAAAGPALKERQALIPRARAELARVTADTGGHREAERNLSQVTAELKKDPRVPRARRDLDSAHDRWEELTGRRPG